MQNKQASVFTIIMSLKNKWSILLIYDEQSIIFAIRERRKSGVANGTLKNVGLGKFWQDLEIFKAFLISLEVLFLHGLFSPFFECRNFLLRSLGLGFLPVTRISASWRVLDFTIRHPLKGINLWAEYRVSKQQISDICKNKEKIIKFAGNSETSEGLKQKSSALG